MVTTTEKYRLTDREWKILGMTIEGYTYAEIAANMGLPEGTVKAYVHNIREKMSPFKTLFRTD